jgi:cephalosporin hydroxylase
MDLSSTIKDGSDRIKVGLKPVRHAVAQRVDPLIVKRYQTLAKREKASADAARSARETVDAFQQVAEQSQRTGRYPKGFEAAAISAFRALADRDLDGTRRSPAVRTALVDQFHRLFYHTKKRTWDDTWFMGTKVWKNPLDLWIYQEMFTELRPDVIVEAGTMWGGSAFYMAKLFDMMDFGRIITIDTVVRNGRPEHPRITYIKGSSADPDIAAEVDTMIKPDEKILVILDSAHTRDHVFAELELWSTRVPVGSYIVVEDTNIHGHPVAANSRPGPMEALNDFLATNKNFVIDHSKEKYFLTFNPRGFLKRVS